MNTATATKSTTALETLTAGQSVLVTLTSGRIIKGEVAETQNLSITGFHATLTVGKRLYSLCHFMRGNTRSDAIACNHFGMKFSNVGTVATIEIV